MKCSHDRRFDPRQQLHNVTASFAAKNSVFVLKGNDVHVRAVKELGGLSVIADHIFADLKQHLAWIFVFGPRLCHRHDEGVEIWIILRDGPMKTIGEGRDTTHPRRMIANECNTLKLSHRDLCPTS